jgi:hypothetical protein
MIWLLADSPSSTGDTQEDRERKTDKLLTGWRRRGFEPNHSTARKLVLYQLFNTFCPKLNILFNNLLGLTFFIDKQRKLHPRPVVKAVKLRDWHTIKNVRIRFPFGFSNATQQGSCV